MDSALDSEESGPGTCTNPGQGHCVVFLFGQDTRMSQFLSPPRCISKWVPANLMLGGNPSIY